MSEPVFGPGPGQPPTPEQIKLESERMLSSMMLSGMTAASDRRRYLRYFRDFYAQAPARFREYSGNTDQPNAHAASLEALQFFRAEVLALGMESGRRELGGAQARILDAGAGASTFMLSHWFADVDSTDPDIDYLKAVLTVCDLPVFDTHTPFERWSVFPFDAIFWDYGTWQRSCSFPRAWKLLAPGGIIYCDDCDTRPDCWPLRSFIRDFAEIVGVPATDCPEAIDEHGRWGIMLQKPGRP